MVCRAEMMSAAVLFFAFCMLINLSAASLGTSTPRLEGGSGLHEGRVEIFYNNTWGTICDDGWGRQEAAVICRRLGYSRTGAIAKSGAFFGPGTGPVWLNNLYCAGTEYYFRDCDYSCTVNACSHNRDASVICKLQYRLVGGTAPNEGRVEVLYGRRWGTVCSDNWGTEEAAIVCGELGFDKSGAVAKQNAYFGAGTLPVWLHNVDCSGQEDTLASCNHNGWGKTACSHSQDVSVVCQPLVRLVDGSGPHEGRVEVFVDGQWGTVCDDGWTSRETRVVCKELGYTTTDAVFKRGAYFGQGTGPILFDDVYCRSSESHLRDCKHSCWDQSNCNHAKDVSVICKVQVRLVGGSGPNEGRVEILYNNVWGTVCDDDWGEEEASVVCRDLGFHPDGAVVRKGSHFGQGSGRIWLDKVKCNGSEPHLSNCENDGIGQATCSHANDVSVICKPIPYRLVGGSGPREGRLEVRINDTWGTVCDQGWGSQEATVVCNELGFPTTRAEAFGGAYFGEGSGPIWLDGVDCGNGRESTVSICKHKPWGTTNCQHNGDVSIICRPSIRLVRGSTPNKGRVEFYNNRYGRWGTICDDQWGPEDASVACRELGFSPNGAIAKSGAYFGQGTGSIWITRVACTGSEPGLYRNCGHSSYYYYNRNNCAHSQDASVICSDEKHLDVLPSVNITMETIHEEFRKMFRFNCDFTGVNYLVFYKALWYVNDELVYTSPVLSGGDTDFRKRLSLTEDQLSRTVGYDIRCEIHASESPTSNVTVSNSESRFIGIKVLTPVLRLKEGEQGQIKIRSTAPIGCYDDIFGCNYGVNAIIPELNTDCSASAKLNNKCGVDILQNGWDYEYTIGVTADISDQYGQSSRQFEVTLRSSDFFGDHLTWSKYTISPRVQVIVEKNTTATQSVICKAYSDPRLRTFKGLNLNVQYLGTYSLYYDQEHDIEVQIQTVGCTRTGTGYCNCGVVARVGRTAYMISKCNSQNWIMEYVLCDDGIDVLKVEKNADYKITFPTGAVVTAHLHNGNPTRYVDVYVTPSVLDDDKARGLCGKISQDNTKQLVLRNGLFTSDVVDYSLARFQDADTFVESWRVASSQSLFNPSVRDNLVTATLTTVTCQCENTAGSPLAEIKCNPDSPVQTCQKNPKYTAVSKRSCSSHTFARRRRSVLAEFPENDSPRRIKREAKWVGNWTEETATTYCRDLFTNNQIVQLCMKQVPTIAADSAIEACIEDIKLTGSTEFVSSSVSSVQSHCVHEVYMEPSYQVETANQASVLVQIVTIDCPVGCLDHGTCNNGTCICNSGYIGVDCATRVDVAPTVDSLEFDGLLDVQRNDTYDEIAVFGGTFIDNAAAKCRITPIELSANGSFKTTSDASVFQATVESIGEVVCPIPGYQQMIVKRSANSRPDSQNMVTGYKIEVSNDGRHYSQPQIMVTFNSDCMTCSNNEGSIRCLISGNHCVSNNRCYNNSESYDLNDQYICKTDGEESRWELDRSKVSDPCLLYSPFPDAENRLTSNMVQRGNSIINDGYLTAGWYGHSGLVIPSVAPGQYRCGTKYPIYLSKDTSNVQYGEEVPMKACIRRYNSLCVATIDIQVKYCQPDLYVYNLESSPLESSAYCLEPMDTPMEQ